MVSPECEKPNEHDNECARNPAHAGSDVDLGVKGLPPRLFYRMHANLEEALDMPVDLVDFDFQKDFYELLLRLGELKKNWMSS